VLNNPPPAEGGGLIAGLPLGIDRLLDFFANQADNYEENAHFYASSSDEDEGSNIGEEDVEEIPSELSLGRGSGDERTDEEGEITE